MEKIKLKDVNLQIIKKKHGIEDFFIPICIFVGFFLLGIIWTNNVAGIIRWGLTIIYFIIAVFVFKKYSIANLNKKRMIDAYTEINSKVRDVLINKNFKIIKIMCISDCFLLNSFSELGIRQILIDSKSEKIALVDYVNVMLFILDFKDIVNCEIYENNIVSGENNGRDFSVKEEYNTMNLVLKINNVENPQIVYETIFKKCVVDGDSEEYSILLNNLQEIKAFFDVINHEKTSKKKKFVYCRSCGAKNDAESLKCVSCGDKL